MDLKLEWTELTNARDILAELCQLFWEGLARPLPFFPDSALAFVEAERAHAANPLNKARHVWNGGYDTPGEKEKPENHKFIGAIDPLTDEFVNLARTILAPLL